MNPREYIKDLCRRYGVSSEFGFRLQPLVERAGRAEPAKRERLLDLVVRSFQQEANRKEEDQASPGPRAVLTMADRKALATVASILHQWSPPRWLDSWGKKKKED